MIANGRPLHENKRRGKSHYFLSKDHAESEKKTWIVIILCAASMVLEIVCGLAFGSLALVGDGLHMSTHACAFFISASAYSYARKHADNPRFVFGTGKVGDLAAYTSAIILAIISLVIIIEGVIRFFKPEPMNYKEALPVAFIGLSVNISSGYILMGCNVPCMKKENDGSTMDHGHGHGHSHGHAVENYEIVDDNDEDADDASHDQHHGHGHGHAHDHDESVTIKTPSGSFVLSIFEEDMPPVFRIAFPPDKSGSWLAGKPAASSIIVTTLRSDGQKQLIKFSEVKSRTATGGFFFQSTDSIPEPHEFEAILSVKGNQHTKSTPHSSTGNAPLEFRVNFKEGSAPELSNAVISPMFNLTMGKEEVSEEEEQGHDMMLGRSNFVSLTGGVVQRLSSSRKDGGSFYGKLQQLDHDHDHDHDGSHNHNHGHNHEVSNTDENALTTSSPLGVEGALGYNTFDHGHNHGPEDMEAGNAHDHTHEFRHGHSHDHHDHDASLSMAGTSNLIDIDLDATRNPRIENGHGHGHEHDRGLIEEECTHVHDHGHGHGHEDRHQTTGGAHDHDHAKEHGSDNPIGGSGKGKDVHSKRNSHRSHGDHGHDHGHADDNGATGSAGHHDNDDDDNHHANDDNLMDHHNGKPAKHEMDNNMRAAIIHVFADAFVSVLVIIAIIIAGNVPNCGWMDPLVGIIGSFVILNWAYVLVVDTTANLLDLNPDPKLTEKLKQRLEGDGSKVTDMHVWRLGPGHLGAIVSIDPPDNGRDVAYYMRRIRGFKALSHVTIEIEKATAAAVPAEAHRIACN